MHCGWYHLGEGTESLTVGERKLNKSLEAGQYVEFLQGFFFKLWPWIPSTMDYNL